MKRSVWRFSAAGIALAVMSFAGVGSMAGEVPPPKQVPLPVGEFTANFHKIPPAQVTGKLFSVGPFLITGGSGAQYNSMTAGWGGFGVLWGKPAATVYVRTERFTYRFLEQEPVFTLSFYPASEKGKLMTVYGRQSGRDTDKEKVSGFTPAETPDGGVSYLQAERVIVCRRVLRFALTKDAVPSEIAKGVSDKSYHVQYTGEVLSVWEKNRQPDPSERRPK